MPVEIQSYIGVYSGWPKADRSLSLLQMFAYDVVLIGNSHWFFCSAGCLRLQRLKTMRWQSWIQRPSPSSQAAAIIKSTVSSAFAPMICRPTCLAVSTAAILSVRPASGALTWWLMSSGGFHVHSAAKTHPHLVEEWPCLTWTWQPS